MNRKSKRTEDDFWPNQERVTIPLQFSKSDVSPFRIDRDAIAVEMGTAFTDYKGIFLMLREWDNCVGALELGNMYRRGYGVLQSYRKAVWYFLRYADRLVEESPPQVSRIEAECSGKLKLRLQACFAFYKASPWQYAEAYAIEQGKARLFRPYLGAEMWRGATVKDLADGLRKLTEYELDLKRRKLVAVKKVVNARG